MAGSGDTNDDTLAPTLVAGLESSAHDVDVASAVESVVTTAVGQLDKLVNDSLVAELSGVNEVGRAKLASPLLLGGVHVDDDDLARLVHDGALDDGQTDTAGTEDRNAGSLLDLGGYPRRTVSGGDTAAEQTGAVHRCVLLHGNDGDVGDDGVLGEGGGAHEVENVLALALEAGRAVWHHALALGGSDLAAEIGLSGLAELALLAFGGAAVEGRRRRL